MTELNIKKEIGKRIFESRKAKGLTLKDLGELAGGLKQTRLTNWEQGTRTPGPEEIKWLAQALDVSPAYLMCLSDEKQYKDVINPCQLIPLFDYQQACAAKENIKAMREKQTTDDVDFVSLSTSLLPKLGTDVFALRMKDDSMVPEIRTKDVLVIDPAISPEPGDFLVVKIANREEVIICQYKKLSFTSSDFELLTLNDNWPNITVCDGVQVEIIGTVVQNIRGYR